MHQDDDSESINSTVSDEIGEPCDNVARREEPKRPQVESQRPGIAKSNDTNRYTEGPQCQNYETFVQSLFKTGQQRLDPSFALNSFSNDFPVNNLSASAQLKLESLTDNGRSYSYSTPFAPYSDSLAKPDSAEGDEKLFAGDREYLNRYRFRSEHMRNLHAAREAEAKEGKKKILLDYKRFRSSPLSPHLYSGDASNYVHLHDSRIVGSDFVMLTLRPNDNFMNKIDKTLAEARKVNSWDV